jgi:hypothetical protein
MIWIRRTLEFRLMTGIAVRVSQLIVVIRVAVLTLSSSVLPRQRKLRRIVIKRSRPP